MTRDIPVSKSVSRCRHYTFSSAAAGVKGGLSSCGTSEYSGFLMDDGGDVYDIHPLKSAHVVGEEERRQSPSHHHLIRKTRDRLERSSLV